MLQQSLRCVAPESHCEGLSALADQLQRKAHRLSEGIFVFGSGEEYWHITCSNGYTRPRKRSELQIETSCLDQQTIKDRFSYMTALARVCELKDDDGKLLWSSQERTAVSARL